MDVTWPNWAANTGWQYVLITCSTYHSNYQERDTIQIFASVHLLLRVDHPRYLSALRKVTCQHYKISENVNWFFFRSWRTRRKKELFLAISVRESTRHLRCERQVGSYERGARRPVNTAKICICQSFYITKVRCLTIHSFPQYVQRDHMTSAHRQDASAWYSSVLCAQRFGSLF